jgi:hypothetical protein
MKKRIAIKQIVMAWITGRVIEAKCRDIWKFTDAVEFVGGPAPRELASIKEARGWADLPFRVPIPCRQVG